MKSSTLREVVIPNPSTWVALVWKVAAKEGQQESQGEQAQRWPHSQLLGAQVREEK